MNKRLWSLIQNHMHQECCESALEQRIAVYINHQQQWICDVHFMIGQKLTCVFFWIVKVSHKCSPLWHQWPTRRLGIEEMRLCMVRAESVLCSLAVLLVDMAPHVCARCSDLAHPTFLLGVGSRPVTWRTTGMHWWCCLPRTALSLQLSRWEMATSKLYIALTPYRRFHCSETSE